MMVALPWRRLSRAGRRLRPQRCRRWLSGGGGHQTAGIDRNVQRAAGNERRIGNDWRRWLCGCEGGWPARVGCWRLCGQCQHDGCQQCFGTATHCGGRHEMVVRRRGVRNVIGCHPGESCVRFRWLLHWARVADRTRSGSGMHVCGSERMTRRALLVRGGCRDKDTEKRNHSLALMMTQRRDAPHMRNRRVSSLHINARQSLGVRSGGNCV